MLLLFRASGDAEGLLDLRFGLSAVATATVTFGLTIALAPPASAELNVSVTPNITLALNGNNIPTTNGIASLAHSLGLTGAPGFAASTAFSTTFQLSGTVGSFLDGQATLAHGFGLTGEGIPQSDASFGIAFGIGGLPDITGGTVTSGASPGIVFDLTTIEGFVDFPTVDISLALDATGASRTGVNPDSELAPRRPRTTLRSFLIGS